MPNSSLTRTSTTTGKLQEPIKTWWLGAGSGILVGPSAKAVDAPATSAQHTPAIAAIGNRLMIRPPTTKRGTRPVNRARGPSVRAVLPSVNRRRHPFDAGGYFSSMMPTDSAGVDELGHQAQRGESCPPM